MPRSPEAQRGAVTASAPSGRGNPPDAERSEVLARLDRLVEALGNNRVAQLVGVSKSQPSRWRSGKERIGPENRCKVLDLDYVFNRLAQVYPQRQAEIWLESMNASLGARPVDVLRLRGVVPVIEAIDAEEQLAYS